MKRRIMLVAVGLIIAVLVACCVILYPKMKEEMSQAHPTVKEFFDKDGNFYVYFMRDECRYCESIEDDINAFSKEVELFVVDASKLSDSKTYDWFEHRKLYDVEIGQLLDDGSIMYYNDTTEEDIVELYPPVEYKIVLAGEAFAEMNEGKEKGKIYAISTHPIIMELSAENFVIPGVPMLVEFDNHEVVNYYFDDIEILEFLGSSTKPVNEYWNLE
ncbi:MAG: hypothetical protein HFH23_11690 [Ruminococcus sp.]|nr:hypothetical protein [Ruminococcus sp.]